MEQGHSDARAVNGTRWAYRLFLVVSAVPWAHWLLQLVSALDPKWSLVMLDRITWVLFHAALISPLLWLPLWLHVRRYKRVVLISVVYGISMLPLVFVFLLFLLLSQ
jgi:hypothetical protein